MPPAELLHSKQNHVEQNRNLNDVVQVFKEKTCITFSPSNERNEVEEEQKTTVKVAKMRLRQNQTPQSRGVAS